VHVFNIFSIRNVASSSLMQTYLWSYWFGLVWPGPNYWCSWTWTSSGPFVAGQYYH